MKNYIWLVYLLTITASMIWGYNPSERFYFIDKQAGTLFYGSLISLVVFFYGNFNNTFSIGIFNFRNYLPGIWTSLGILGTFITLYSQLTTGTGLDKIFSQNTNDIANFLKNFGSAFSTSIVGIIGSMITKMVLTYVDEVDEIEKRTERSYLSEMVSLLHQQIKNAETQQIDNQKFAENKFTVVAAKLQSIIEVQETGQQFLKNLIADQNAQLEQTKATLLGLKTMFETQMTALVASITENIKPQIAELAEKMFGNLEKITTGLSKTAENNLQKNYDVMMEESKKVIEAQTKVLNSIFTEIKTNQENQKTTLETTSKAMETQLQTTTDAMAKQVKNNSDALTTQLQSIQEKQTELQTAAADNLQNLQNTAAQQLKESSNALKTQLESLKIEQTNLQNEASTNLQNLQDAAAKQVQNLQTKFENVVGAYFKNITSLLETVQDWQTKNKTMVEAANTAFSKAVEMHDKNVLLQTNLDTKLADRLQQLDNQDAKLQAFEQSAQQLHKDLKGQNADLLVKLERISNVLEAVTENWPN